MDNWMEKFDKTAVYLNPFFNDYNIPKGGSNCL